MSRVRFQQYLGSLQVSRGEVVALDEGALFVDDLVDTVVRVEVGLDVFEEGDRTVGTSTTVKASEMHESIRQYRR